MACYIRIIDGYGDHIAGYSVESYEVKTKDKLSILEFHKKHVDSYDHSKLKSKCLGHYRKHLKFPITIQVIKKRRNSKKTVKKVVYERVMQLK